MEIYNLFWKEDKRVTWAFLGSYDSKESARKSIEETFAFLDISEEEEEEYINDFFIEIVKLNDHVITEFAERM